MRKLIYAINLTIDGCFDHTHGIVTDELMDYFTNLTRNVGLLAFGRKTYELMVPYWPDVAKDKAGQTRADYDYAQAFVSTDKIVFSRTLADIDDKRTRLVRTDVQDEIGKLKQESGKDILIGGVALSSHLIQLGLVDEFLFIVHPVIAGKGRRLMEDIGLPEKLKLRLLDSKPIAAGHVALRYAKNLESQ